MEEDFAWYGDRNVVSDRIQIISLGRRRRFFEGLGLVIQLLVHHELAEEVIVECVIVAAVSHISVLAAASICVAVSRLSLVDQGGVVHKPTA